MPTVVLRLKETILMNKDEYMSQTTSSGPRYFRQITDFINKRIVGQFFRNDNKAKVMLFTIDTIISYVPVNGYLSIRPISIFAPKKITMHMKKNILSTWMRQ